MFDPDDTADEQDDYERIFGTHKASADDTREPDKGRLCPYCHGTTISPYPDDGGSCPHCILGYIK